MQVSVDAADVEENTKREEMEMLTGPWGKQLACKSAKRSRDGRG